MFMCGIDSPQNTPHIYTVEENEQFYFSLGNVSLCSRPL